MKVHKLISKPDSHNGILWVFVFFPMLSSLIFKMEICHPSRKSIGSVDDSAYWKVTYTNIMTQEL